MFANGKSERTLQRCANKAQQFLSNKIQCEKGHAHTNKNEGNNNRNRDVNHFQPYFTRKCENEKFIVLFHVVIVIERSKIKILSI